LTFFFKLAPQYGNQLGIEKQWGMQGLLLMSEVVKSYNPTLFKKYEAALNNFYPMYSATMQSQMPQQNDSSYEEE